jgi:hypothetical protein
MPSPEHHAETITRSRSLNFRERGPCRRVCRRRSTARDRDRAFPVCTGPPVPADTRERVNGPTASPVRGLPAPARAEPGHTPGTYLDKVATPLASHALDLTRSLRLTPSEQAILSAQALLGNIPAQRLPDRPENLKPTLAYTPPCVAPRSAYNPRHGPVCAGAATSKPVQSPRSPLPSVSSDGERGLVGHPKFCGLVVSAASLPFDADFRRVEARAATIHGGCLLVVWGWVVVSVRGPLVRYWSATALVAGVWL